MSVFAGIWGGYRLGREQFGTEKEKDIAASQIKDKPPQVVEKIVQGKIDKFLSSICLLEQGFIKDPETTIEQLTKSMIAKLGENIRIRRFVRYAVGEEA